MYDISAILSTSHNEETPDHDVFQRVVERLPCGWEFPEHAYARLRIRDRVYTTGNFAESEWVLREAILAGDTLAGELEVAYTTQPPGFAERGFLEEEAQLLKEVAQRIGDYAVHTETRWALEENMRRLHRFAEHVPGILYQFYLYRDGSMRIPYVAGGLLHTLGLSEEAIKEDASVLMGMVFEEDRESLHVSIRTSAEHMTPWEWLGRFRHGSDIRWVQGTAQPRSRARGNVLWDGVLLDVTERMRARLEVHNLARYPEENPHPIIRISHNDEIHYANPASHSMLEYWRSEAGKPSYADFIAHTQYALKTENTYSKDLALNDAFYTFTFLPDPLAGYVNAYGIDITDRKRAEDELRDTQTRLQRALEGTSDGLWDWDLVGDDHWCSPRFAEMLGRKLDEMPATTDAFLPFIHPEDRDLAFDAVRRHIEEGEPYDVEYRIRVKQGHYRWFHMRGKAIRDEAGNAVRMAGSIQDVTERKEAEDQLRASELKYKRLIENLSNDYFVYSHGLDGVFNFVSPSVQTVLGYTEDEFMTHYSKYLTNNPVNSVAEERITLVGQGINQPSYEIETYHKDGRRRWLEVSETPVFDDAGEVVSVEGVAHDITERKVAEEALRSSRKNFLSIVEHNTDGIIVTSKDGEIVFVNSAAERLFQKSPEELVGTYFGAAYEADEATEIEIVQDLEHIRTGELRVTSTEWEGAPAVLYMIRDVTERKQAEEARIQFKTAIDQLAESIVITDAAGRIKYVNPAFEHTTGYSTAEVVEQNPRILKSGKHSGEFYKEMWNTLRTGNIWRGFITDRCKDGSLIEEVMSITPVHNDEGEITHYVAVKRDVTQERIQEARARQAQKLEAIGTLAGGIAHDFNNILSAIIGYTQFAYSDLPEDSRTREDLEQVLQAGSRAKDLVQQILQFSRRTEHEPEPVRLDLIVKGALKLLRASLPTTIEIRQELEEDTGEVLGDPTQLHQIMMNLCTNAYHAMREKGGKLTVSLQTYEYNTDESMHPTQLEPGSYVRLSVADTGCGMEREVVDRIFEPFYTTKTKDEGTGLGLSTVHGVVKSHGGAITVYSEPGNGTVFHVYIPRIVRGKPIRTEQRPADPMHLGGGEHIVIVDDEQALATLGKRILEKAGYNVTAFTHPEQAMKLIEADPGAVDMIITDQTMPGMTGLEFSRRAKEIRADLPVILLTGFSDQMTSERLEFAGVRELIMKPVQFRDLIKAIAQYMPNKSHDTNDEP